MAMNRKTGTTLFTIGGILVGLGLGWLIFSPKTPTASLAGKPCTLAGGAKGTTDATGTCKA